MLRKLFVLLVACSLFTSVSVSTWSQQTPWPADKGTAEKDAQAAAERWLTLIDNGNYGESYDALASFVKAKITKKEWVRQHKHPERHSQTVNPTRVISRQLRSASVASSCRDVPNEGFRDLCRDLLPNGEYLVLDYESKYDKDFEGSEMVVMTCDHDGKWRVAWHGQSWTYEM